MKRRRVVANGQRTEATNVAKVPRPTAWTRRFIRIMSTPSPAPESASLLGVDVPVENIDEPEGQTASEFLWLLLIPLATGCLFVCIYALLRTKDAYCKRIYAPRLLSEETKDDKPSPENLQYLPKNFFRALRQLLRYGEDDILRYRGADLCTLVKLQKTAIKLSAFFAFFGWTIIVPINLTANGFLPAVDDQWYNKLSMANVEQRSERFWAHLILCYLFTFATFKLLFDATKEVVQSRIQHVLRDDSGIEAYTVMVTDVPHAPTSTASETDESRGQMSSGSGSHGSVILDHAAAAASLLKKTVFPKHSIVSDDIKNFFELEFPGKVYHICCVPKDLKDVQTLWERYNRNLEKLQRAKVDFEIGDGQGFLLLKKDAPRLDPSIPKEAKKLEEIREKYEHYKTKTSLMKKELENLQEEASNRPVVAAFVTLTSRRDAGAAGQVVHSHDGTLWIVSPALEPGAINWQNLGLKRWSRHGRSVAVGFLHICLIFLWMIPVFFVSSLTTLSNLEEWLPFVADLPGWLRGFLQGFLPGLALMLFNMFLPPLCRWLTSLEGVQTVLELDAGMSSKLFSFQVFNTFLGVTVMSSILSQLDDIVNGQFDFTEIIELLGDAVPTTALFFLNYLLLACWAAAPQDLVRLVDIVMMHIKERFLCRTADDKDSLGQAGAPSFGLLVPANMLLLLISIVFSIINPLVTPFAFMGMSVVYVVTLHQSLFVFGQNSYESGGMIWMVMLKQCMWILFLMHLTLAGVFLLKKVPVIAGLTIPLWFCTYAFYAYCVDRFGRPLHFAPMQSISAKEKAEAGSSASEMLRLERMEYEEQHMALLSAFEKTSYSVPCMQPPADLEHALSK